MYILEQYSIAAAYPSDMPVLSFCPCKSSADTLFELDPVAIRVKNACFTVKNHLPSPGKIFFEPCRMFADFFRFTVNASDTDCYTYKEKAGSSCQVISVGSFCQKIHETAVKTRERVRHFRSFDKNISRVMRLWKIQHSPSVKKSEISKDTAELKNSVARYLFVFLREQNRIKPAENSGGAESEWKNMEAEIIFCRCSLFHVCK